MKRLFFVAALTSSVLFGAGCAKPSTTPPPTNQPTTPSTPPTTTPTTPPTPSTPATSTSNLPPIDSTWKTYTNAALKFAFQYPTKGKYAPAYSVSFVREGDVQIKNGCMLSGANEDPNAKTLNVGNVSFCHSSFASGAAGSLYLEDYYATKNGNQYVVITFTKKLTNSGALGCANANENPWTLGGCALFSQDDYRATLDQIVNTFGYQS